MHVKSDLTGVITQISVKEGQIVKKGSPLLSIESMKMETIINADQHGKIKSIFVSQGELIEEDTSLYDIEVLSTTDEETKAGSSRSHDYSDVRPSLAELRHRRSLLMDEARSNAIAKRHTKGHLSARASIDLIIDTDSFHEYGSYVIAAQRSRRTEEDLIKNTPADGLVAGTAKINSDTQQSNLTAMIMAYDYTVLAGTQGAFNHLKMDRMLEIAHERKLPVVLLAEGGGGRPGDIDHQVVAGLHVMTFYKYAALDGIVPRIAVVTGYCFAGNAALAGTSDIIIATQSSSIGMGGPAMIKGGGLGDFHPKEIGPAKTQSTNGVIDILVEDDKAAMLTAKKVMSYFQGATNTFQAADQKVLQEIIPTERRRVYQIRDIIETLCDTDSVTELKSQHARSAVTCFVRIAGKPYGLIANDCRREAGAITAAAADKLTNFLSLCGKYNLPVISLVDCPGLMVGPKAEAMGTVKAAGRLFNVSAKLAVPIYAIIVRRGFGLGAMAMTGGSFHATRFTISWPMGQFGAMGIEGAVQLGFKKELAAVEDPTEREKLYNKMVDDMYHRGRAINMAAYLELDEVIDPAHTREWIISASN